MSFKYKEQRIDEDDLLFEEYDTQIGNAKWHVRKYDSGYCELFGKIEYSGVNISKPYGSIYTSTNINYGVLPLPLKLTELYTEVESAYCNDAGVMLGYNGVKNIDLLSQTKTVYFWRFDNAFTSITVGLNVYITGYYK